MEASADRIDSGAIPCVDLGDRPEVCAAGAGTALRELGAFRLTGHGIVPQAIADAYEATDRLRRLDDAVKREVAVGTVTAARGWHRGETAGHGSYETFELGRGGEPGDPATPRGVLDGPNLWPALPGFRELVEPCFDAALTLAHRLAELFEQALGLPEAYLTGRATDPYCLLRLLHYPESTRESTPGLAAHTDVELFTLLLSDSPGLEICKRDGTWLAAPAGGTEDLIVLAGDLLEIVAGGEVESPLHRVVGDGGRRSLGFFMGLDAEAVISPQRPVTEARRHLYASTVVGQQLAEQYLHYFPHLRRRHEAGEVMPELVVPGENRYERYKLERLERR
ncbi:MAG: 2OG-Fe(II) oxygenase family protein [Thermoleophilaceae bacterium]